MTDRNDFIGRSCAAVLVCLLVTLLAGADPPARAAPLSAPTFTVNSIFDVVASPPLDNGICETEPGNGKCTLRAAIMKANSYPGGGVTIILPALTGGAKYLLTIDRLLITDTMSIIGGGAAATIIDGSEMTTTDPLLFIYQAVTVTISGVTIQGGHAGGIIALDSALTLHDSIVTSNTTTGYGGGIYDEFGTLAVIDSIFSHNTAGYLGGGIDIGDSVATLSRVTISSNTSAQGGGVFHFGSTLLDIVDSTISDNAATEGGGIYNDGTFLAVINSTISGNHSSGNGGAIFNSNYWNCCTLFLYNATIVGNRANEAIQGGTGGGIFNTISSTIQLANALLDGNVHKTSGPDVFDDCSGTVTSYSYNLFSHTAGCTISGGTHDLKGAPGQTEPLQDNGGPTFTNALLPGSPAIDAIPLGANGCGTTLTTDQRGDPRPDDADDADDAAGSPRCDIGAFELQRTLYLPLVRK